jgi:hypothetical protein
MTLPELVSRFPEIPADLRQEPVLAELARDCADLLAVARQPSACATQHDAANHYYLKLIGPLAIYGYGLFSREKALGQISDLLARRRSDPAGFAASLLPADVAAQEQKGPGCA